MNLHDFFQLQILGLGIGGRWIVGRGTMRALRVATWVSIANLPAWFYVAWESRSWGLALLNAVYAVLYVRALLNLRSNR